MAIKSLNKALQAAYEIKRRKTTKGKSMAIVKWRHEMKKALG